jgi:excisionase family DNA binding protein
MICDALQSAEFCGLDILRIVGTNKYSLPTCLRENDCRDRKWTATMTIYSYSMPRLYSDAEAADRLGISVATLRRLRIRGELGHLAIGRRVFVTEDQLKELLRRGRRESSAFGNDAFGDGQATSGTTSPSSARRSRLDPTSDRTSDDLRQAYESAQVESNVDDSYLASWLPDHYLRPAKSRRK